MYSDLDEAIVRDVQDGDTEAFATLVKRHQDRVYGMLMRMTGDTQTAEELAHETFVRAYRGLKKFRRDSRFGTWLIQIAVHLVRDRIRENQRNRLRVVSLDAMLEHEADTAILTESRAQYDPLAEISERDLVRRFEAALQELPASYREVFILRQVEGLSYEEIKRLTGDSVGSLKVRTHRARKLLKEMLFGETEHQASRPSQTDR